MGTLALSFESCFFLVLLNSFSYFQPTGSFDVEFPRIGTSDYVILRDVITTPLTAMSVCLWMKTSDTSSTGSLFSYSALANGGSDNEFLIINYKGFQMMVNGKDR